MDNKVHKNSNQLVSLTFKAISSIGFFLLVFFLPAGTWDYWQAWVYLGIILVSFAWIAVFLARKDPALLKRRMKDKETEVQQKWVILFSFVFLLPVFLLPGFDKRWGWSHVPTIVVIAADLLVLLGFYIYYRVMRENTFASRVIEVEQGQKVIDTGPYALVRHPMYVGVLLSYLFTPLALASWWAVLPALAIIPVLILRILNEEKVLARDLPGYAEYMETVKYRLIPGIW